MVVFMDDFSVFCHNCDNSLSSINQGKRKCVWSFEETEKHNNMENLRI